MEIAQVEEELEEGERRDNNKVAGLVIILIVLAICATVLGGIYIRARCESKTGMFADPKYEQRISKLEKQMEELKRE